LGSAKEQWDDFHDQIDVIFLFNPMSTAGHAVEEQNSV
jgi:hypothetical protein